MSRMKYGIALIGLVSSLSMADVSIKNGNFFMGYTDIVYPGGFTPKIERVYNSKSAYRGMFGWGWGNEYEAYLTVSADGSVVVHEYGGGAENRFSPAAFNEAELNKAVSDIAEAARKAGVVGSSAQLEAYKKRLRGDATYRNDEWEKFRGQGKLQARQLPKNTRLHSNRFSYQFVTRTEDGYVRQFDNGRMERFNNAGKLVRIADKNNNSIDLTYREDGKLVRLVDNFNRKMFFSYDGQGRLEKIQGENGKEATYKYNDLGELVHSKDVDGNVHAYKYSADKRHNLVEIGYADKSKLEVTYYGRDLHENVKSVKERDGTLKEYTYQSNPRDKGQTLIGVSIKDPKGKVISQSKYEYFVKTRADGEEWTYKMVTSLDGDRTETVYNECCGLPLLIKRGGEETSFEYDSKGHVTKKITPTDITELKYDQKIGKVTMVIKYPKKNKKKKTWSSFQYDAKGNLTLAKNSSGKGAKLFYDSSGRIRTMVDQAGKRIDFKYNENSKPVEISDPSVGTITVTYNNSGEIKKVDSSAGRKVAMQVTSAFQNLLDIVRPAGVSLSF